MKKRTTSVYMCVRVLQRPGGVCGAAATGEGGRVETLAARTG